MNNLKIAHLISDQKFPDSAYEQFERVAPKCSDFYIATEPKKLKYIKKVPVKFINKDSYKSKLFIRKLATYDFVVLHALTNFNIRLVAQTMNTKIKYVWIGMGYDYYDLLYPIKEDLLLDKTKEIALKNIKTNNNNKLIQMIKNFIKSIVYKRSEKEKIISRIDYFSPVLGTEYELIKQKYLARKSDKFPKYILWNYNVGDVVDDLNAPILNRKENGILLGNSSTYTNNHIEILDFLQNHKSSFSNILCPLSYGDAIYADNIDRIGNKYYGDHFISLRTFMPYDEYLTIISKSPIVIMNHKRQQAAGNIIVMLFKGATVFLREENPLYDHYINMGIILFSIQELINSPELLERRLTDKEIKSNRQLIKTFMGTEASLKKTKNLIETISGKIIRTSISC